MSIVIKRIYEKSARTDGARVLVDRLWPRGISKSRARLTMWMKDIAPSTQLRQWFGHDPKRWSTFRRKYISELRKNAALLEKLQNMRKQRKVLTLLYGAKDEKHNEAVVVKDILSK